jgi:tol-pal system protein YbgF
MHAVRLARSVSSVLSSGALTLAALWPLQSHAFLSDDEARKAILELRQRVETNRQGAEAAMNEVREGQTTARRSLLELANQIEQLRAELARVRGQNEQLAREVSELQRQQKDVQTGIDERLRQVEPLRISHDGQNFTAVPSEKRDFDSALEALRRSEFTQAATAFNTFLRRYPESGYTPSALYWLGNAQYATRAYKESMESHRRLATQFSDHPRAPEAMLAMANSQIELKDTRSARRTLEDLVKAHPDSEAAAAGRERLARLR